MPEHTHPGAHPATQAVGGASVLIVGGGFAGATAARTLVDRGHRVLVLDKGRGPGGRCSTRRSDVMTVDHGAQYFTARDPRFKQAVEAWGGHEVVARWPGRFREYKADQLTPAHDHDRWVGTPGMSRIVAHQLEGIDVRFNQRVSQVSHTGQGWSAQTETDDTFGPFDRLIIAVPSVQAHELLSDVSPTLAGAAQRAEMAPCWAVMAAFEGKVDAPFDGVKFPEHDTLGWIAQNNSKPGREAGGPDVWVIHAGDGWSTEHVELDRDAAGQIVFDAFARFCESQRISLPALIQLRAHRWRYARTRVPAGELSLIDPELGITLCGDWLHGAKIEAAYLSGLNAADRV